LTLSQSTVTGNSTTGDRSRGGGINTGLDSLTLIESVVSGNSTTGDNSDGGGIQSGALTVTGSTISGNSTAGASADGGGIRAVNLTLLQSTITDNHAHGAVGGGVYFHTSSTISGTILAGNTASGGSADINGIPTINFSLIGTGVTPDAGTSGNNIVTDVPLLGPLADNGGPTQTHALLPGSLALDASNSSLLTDQRGLPVPVDLPGTANSPGGNGSDIGAYEAQAAPSADFNDDGNIDGSDFLAWQRGVGTSGATPAEGDSDHDADVDASDLAAWQLTYGQAIVAPVSAQVEPLATTASASDWVFLDAALAITGLESLQATDEQGSDWVAPALLPEMLIAAGVSSTWLAEAGSSYAEELPRSAADEAETVWLSEELLEHVFS
jgi:hypothetical protein